jgi:hypothetical protein
MSSSGSDNEHKLPWGTFQTSSSEGIPSHELIFGNPAGELTRGTPARGRPQGDHAHEVPWEQPSAEAYLGDLSP